MCDASAGMLRRLAIRAWRMVDSRHPELDDPANVLIVALSFIDFVPGPIGSEV
jgi:hypothetical protein